jgi:hypothetical protein
VYSVESFPQKTSSAHKNICFYRNMTLINLSKLQEAWAQRNNDGDQSYRLTASQFSLLHIPPVHLRGHSVRALLLCLSAVHMTSNRVLICCFDASVHLLRVFPFVSTMKTEAAQFSETLVSTKPHDIEFYKPVGLSFFETQLLSF